MRVPLDRVANVSIPRSMPVTCQVVGKRRAGTSAQEMQVYHSSASRLSVTVFGVPSIGRDQRTAMRPSLERARNLLSKAAQLPNCL
jgi:hypothetical protein